MHIAKAIAAALTAALSALAGVLASNDGELSTVGWINLAIVAVGAVNVYLGPNVPGASVTKALLAATAAVLTLAVDLLADGVTLAEWLQLAVAALGALAVYATPNATPGAHARPVVGEAEPPPTANPDTP